MSALKYKVRSRENKPPELIAVDSNGKEFSLQDTNPIERIRRYKTEIYQLYCPRLKQQTALSAITAGIIFTNAKKPDVEELLRPFYQYWNMERTAKYYPLSGSDELANRALTDVFPESQRQSSFHMNEVLAKDLRNWLVEPDFAAIQRQPLELDAAQLRYVNTRTRSGYRRLKGPAGSGKSIVLAARAAQLISEGKTVLVITFNITLLHYLMDLAVRWPHGNGNTRRDITWLNLHSWCKRVCEETDHAEEYRKLWHGYFESEQDILDPNIRGSPSLAKPINEDIPRLTADSIDSDHGHLVTKYDAILVDEGQDFLPNWWNALRKVCKPGGEMLLVADATQDIYGTARAWTDEVMKGAGFLGQWVTLSISYRLPPQIILAARDFASQYLQKDLVDLPQSPQGELALYPCEMRWIQTSDKRAAEVCTKAILEMPLLADPDTLVIPDITFLTPNQKLGLEVVSNLKNHGISTVHTFSDDERESRRLKMGFYMGVARVKATTLHSFKGWETRGLVAYIGSRFGPRNLALAYMGLTRIKRHDMSSYITIVSAVPELEEYGRKWFSYVQE